MWTCPKCKEWRFDDAKECNCKEFHIIDEDGETYEVRAMDEEGAALKYAQESNEDGDYWLMNESAEISVNGNPFRIKAEPDIHYSAQDLAEE